MAAVAWFMATWWLGQDFGLLGGTGTDPNLSLPVVILLVASELSATSVARREPVAPAGIGGLGALLGITEAGLGVIAALSATPYALSQAPTAAAVVSGGAVLSTAGQRMPDISLTNQFGRSVSMRKWHGKAVVLTFLDPVCYDACPMIAAQVRMADARLGKAASRVEFVAVDANPRFNTVSDIRTFDTEQGLSRLPNWQFLTGPLPKLQRVWSYFGVTVQVSPLAMVGHSQLIYFVDPTGRVSTMVGDSALAQAGVTSAYATLVDGQVRSLLTP